MSRSVRLRHGLTGDEMMMRRSRFPQKGSAVKILRFMVRHVLGVEECEVNMEGHHLFLVGGRNGSGKTSAIQALRMALGGRREMDWPDVPLKDGKSSGMVEIDLSGDEEMQDAKGFKVQLHFHRRRGGKIAEELVLLDSTGDPAPEPRKLLKSLFEFRAFDPLSFDRAKPKEQAEMIRKLLRLDFTAIDKKRAEAYAERTVVNRDLKAAESRRDAIKYPPNTPNAKVSVAALVAEKEAAVKANQAVDDLVQRADNAAAEVGRLEDAEKKLLEQLAKLRDAKSEQEALAARLKAEADAAVKVDVSSIQERIEQADSVNAAVEAKAQAQQLDHEIHRLSRESDRHSKVIEEVDAEKQHRLETAEWPLPGMSLDENGVLVDGLPLEQVNTARRTKLSTLIGMQLNPKLRLLMCEHGNDLDMESLKELDAICKEHDFQMLLEMVTKTEADEGACKVVFESGELVPEHLVGVRREKAGA